MKKRSDAKRRMGRVGTTLVIGVLITLSGCTSYNPYTGRYEPDPGMTILAVGTAALVGAAIYDYNRNYYYNRPYPQQSYRYVRPSPKQYYRYNRPYSHRQYYYNRPRHYYHQPRYRY